MAKIDPFEFVNAPVDLDYTPVEEAIKRIQEASQGIENATLSLDVENWYDSHTVTACISGRRRKTEEQINRETEAAKEQERAQRKRRADAKKRQEENERATYLKLKEKYGDS